jgi:hypothetical protein
MTNNLREKGVALARHIVTFPFVSHFRLCVEVTDKPIRDQRWSLDQNTLFRNVVFCEHILKSEQILIDVNQI